MDRPTQPFDRRAFRDALGYFATGVCIATTRGPDSQPIGLTVNSFTSVSLDPPLILFCLDKGADSMEAFSVATGFAVNILAADQKPLSNSFAKLKGAERWQGVVWDAWDSGSPVLADSLAVLDCAVHARHDGGDHVIVVGRVLGIGTRTDGAPLLYYRGAYAALA